MNFASFAVERKVTLGERGQVPGFVATTAVSCAKRL